jgi:hypothetical protein
LQLPPPGTSTTDSLVRDSASIRVIALRSGPATLTGKVINAGGVPIGGALVTVQGGMSSGKTAPDGSFTLTGVPLGTQAVLARHVGYLPVERYVDLSTNGPNTLTIRLSQSQARLTPIEVRAKLPSELKTVGFERRRKRGLGRFMTEDEIEKAQPTYTSDLLRRINGLHVIGSGTDVHVLSSRGEGCVRYLIDRNNLDPNDGMEIDEMIGPHDIVAIEFYQANDVPMELMNGRNTGCALVVVWTRAQLKEVQSTSK